MQSLEVRPRSPVGLDELNLKLAEHLRFRGGFFVEVGANDGISQSNTVYLERYLGWRGLLIEGIPELFQKCKMNRPNAIVEQCALVAKDFSETTVTMQYCNLMSIVQGARASLEGDKAYVTAGCEHLGPDEVPYAVNVQARTLTSVLDSHEISQVDFLSLDVEGYEGQVLRGLDFSRYAPRFILVECNIPIDVEEALDGRYEFVAQLSHHHSDRLYRLRE